MAKRWVYFFGDGKADGKGDMKDLLGGKGAGLAEMTKLKIPVPAGFTITTDACNEYFRLRQKYPTGLWKQVEDNLKKVEKAMGMNLGDPVNPLLVSVRSGAKFSMPGMMDTVLNLGLNDTTLKAIIKKTRNKRFGYDAYRRFITMFADIVMGVDRRKFEDALDRMKKKKGAKQDTDLKAADLAELVEVFKGIYRKEVRKPFPEEPMEQLRLAINAVFGSWNGERAKKYRKLNDISDELGTACNIQAMVFGNMGNTSGTGVAFTRNPSTGERKFFGECLLNAQGEDVVAGIRTPLPVTRLKTRMPKAYADLMKIQKKLERHYRDMLDIEFTIQEKKLYMLQSRVGKRTAAAALKIAVDMVSERLIDKKTAVSRIDPVQLDQLLHPMIDPKAKLDILAKGLPASPGAAAGEAIFTADDAEAAAERGEKVILVRLETSPEDIGGMHAAQGILTARGGMTSHAAVVARGMGKCCIAGCGAIQINESKKYFTVGNVKVKQGDFITLNGTTGEVIVGEAPLMTPKLTGDFNKLMAWADGIRKLKVRTNADTPHDAQVARDFGAEGIGLCRTEHMFFEGNRIKAVRQMILADNTKGREKALKKLLPMQRGDFIGIFEAMKGLPVTVRLLDPPLHEFLPHTAADIKDLAISMKVKPSVLEAKNATLHEFNPMLGHRGCRLGITYPEIYAMQARAIMEAACELAKRRITVEPEIMIPLVGHVKELRDLRKVVVDTCKTVMKEYGKRVKYTVGTMIELPRAAVTANEIAAEADFFSFGTNDLTQTTFGLSRDDAGRFLPHYVEAGILDEDPFVSIDKTGVGELIKMGVERGRSVKKRLKVGICGEHGGEARSVEFCHGVGMDYVSCSPFRVPIARLAAAQAQLKEKSGVDLSKSTL